MRPMDKVVSQVGFIQLFTVTLLTYSELSQLLKGVAPTNKFLVRAFEVRILMTINTT